jgi:hypothetical protein
MSSTRIMPASWIVFIVLLSAIVPSTVWAQAVTPFQIVGHIQQFRLDTTVCPTATPASFTGARMVVNSVEVIIPCYTVILMPAAYKTPRQIFDEAKGISKVNNESGLALRDQTPPLAAFEVSLDGNIVCNPGCRYIAGQVHISQQSLNAGAGFIKAINMTTGELRVGADLSATITNADARVHLNDPEVEGQTTGRYGLSNKQQFPAVLLNTNPNSRFPDDRFQVDQDNPTVHALSGYPMCVPRSNADPDCPRNNRPLDNNATPPTPLRIFVMTGTDLPSPAPDFPIIRACTPTCDPTKQVPLLVGDYITYQGTLASHLDPNDPTQSIQYISAHTVEANLGIYSAPGTDPAYVVIEPILIGTRGDNVICGTTAECQDRIKVEGFTTDPSRPVNVYAVDVTPDGSGNFTTTLRLIGPGTTKPVPLGRFRFISEANSAVLFDRTNTLRGATRELIARVEANAGVVIGDSKPLNDLPLFAHGLQAGQYQAPIGEYIYPEGHDLGGTLPVLNFQCLSFLARGWSLDSLLLQRLDPWPGFNDLPADPRFFSCTR